MTASEILPLTAPSLDDIREAARRLEGVATRTPLLSFPVLDEATGARVFLKAEIFQRTGSFKFRGAYNKLARLPASQRMAGVVAFSSGNHAQGVAAAAALLQMPAAIVMPTDAPRSKIARTRALGAEVVLYDRVREDREAIAADLARRRRAALVPPYDDLDVIAGQGTVGLEIAADLRAQGARADFALVPASGGGLMAGTAIALRHAFPDARLFIAEPEGFDDHARALQSGRREPNARADGSICDALLARMPGELTFRVNQKLVAGGVAVTDREVADAVAFAFHELKLVVEPGGAVGLAALLSGDFQAKDRSVVVVLSGGNIDASLFARIIADRA